jgi:iron complex transport system substrate-binding protein
VVRVVSLLPSATEIVYALGLDDQLVGVTFECNEPARARIDKAVVVGGRDTSGMTPGDIDAYVRAQVAAGADLYTLHADALGGLAPDVVLTQDLCRVCALPAGDVEGALVHLGCPADVLTLDPHSLEDVLSSISTVGVRLGAAEQATALVTSLRDRLDGVSRAVGQEPAPTVLMLEWIDPPFTAGHWVPDLVTAAGGVPLAAHPGGRSVPITWPELESTRPDVMIVAPCGYGLDDAWLQAKEIVHHFPGIPVWAIDADGLVVRPGPRLVAGVEAIASVLHPARVPPQPERIRRVG